MKFKELKLEGKMFESLDKNMSAHFGPHYINVMRDFQATHTQFLMTNGDPEIPPGQEKLAQSALTNYFMYYCFGVANTIDPKSTFNAKYDDAKNNGIIKDIENQVNQEGK